jgi:hypothetical protein
VGAEGQLDEKKFGFCEEQRKGMEMYQAATFEMP